MTTSPEPSTDLVEEPEIADHLAARTPKQRLFIEAMVHEGKEMKAAAKSAGLSTRQAWNLMRDPEILKAIKDETKVLRASVRPQAILNLVKLGKQRKNMSAAVQASGKLLGEEDAGRAQVNINITPGYAIDLTERARDHVIDGEV
ncbi:MAG: hypothetical protein ACREDP_12800, partial [Bradyrhizobium sp.]